MEPAPAAPDDASPPFTVGQTPSWWGAWAMLGVVALVLVPAILEGPRGGRDPLAESWRLAQACFYAILFTLIAHSSLAGRRRVRFEPAGIVFAAGGLRRERRVRADELDHALVGVDEAVVSLVARRAAEGVVLPSLALRRLPAGEAARVRRWLVARVPIRFVVGAPTAGWTPAAPPPPAPDGVLRVGVPAVTRRDALRIGGAALALTGAFAGWAVVRGVPIAPVLGSLAVGLAMLGSLPAGVVSLGPDGIRWRRTLWSRERRVALADLSRADERLDGTVVLVAREPAGRVVGPRFAFSRLAESDALLVRRWLAAHLLVRGYHGDRVPWADRAA